MESGSRRLGYILAKPELSAGVRKVHDFLTVGAPAPLQEAAAVAIETVWGIGYRLGKEDA